MAQNSYWTGRILCAVRLHAGAGRPGMVAVAEVLARTGGARYGCGVGAAGLSRDHGETDRNKGGTGLSGSRAEGGLARFGGDGCGDCDGWQRETLAACVRTRSAGAVGDGGRAVLEI